MCYTNVTITERIPSARLVGRNRRARNLFINKLLNPKPEIIYNEIKPCVPCQLSQSQNPATIFMDLARKVGEPFDAAFWKYWEKYLEEEIIIRNTESKEERIFVTHEMPCWQGCFDAIIDGTVSAFAVAYSLGYDLNIGDLIILERRGGEKEEYLGEKVTVKIEDISRNEELHYATVMVVLVEEG